MKLTLTRILNRGLVLGTLAIVLGFSSVISVFAAAGASTSFSLDRTSVTVGEQVRATINVAITEFTAGSVELRVNYDANALEYVSLDDANSAFPFPYPLSTSSGSVTLGRYTDASGATGNAKITTLVFRTKTVGTSTLSMSNLAIYEAGTGVSRPISGGSTTITANAAATATPTPTPPPAASVKKFNASPSKITKGDTVKLEWESDNASEVTLEPGVGGVSQNGSTTVRPESTTTYTLTVKGPGGNNTANVRVEVQDPAAPNIKFFSASNGTITRGDGVNLSWSVDGASEVEINNGVGKVGTSGQKEVKPTSKTTYTLTARGNGKTSTANVTVNVNVPQATAKPTAAPTAAPTATAKPTTAPTATPSSSTVSATQSTVTFSSTSAIADGIDTITITATVRSDAGTVLTDIEPVINGLRENYDTASPFVFDTISESWISQLSSVEPGLSTIIVTAQDVQIGGQDVTFTEAEPSALPSIEPVDSGSSFGTALLIGLLFLLVLLLVLFFLWRRLKNRDEEDEGYFDEGGDDNGPAYPGDESVTTPEATPAAPETPAQEPAPQQPAPQDENRPPTFSAAAALQRSGGQQEPAAQPTQPNDTIPL